MNITSLFKTGLRMANSNAPVILTAFGVVGVATTSVLVAKASFEAADRIRKEQEDRFVKAGFQSSLEKSEKIRLVWPLYISAVSSGVLSCGAIIMSHRISSRRAAMLAAAYALNEGRLEEYQEKIKEKFGVKKEREARDEVIQEKINRHYDETEVLFHPTDGKVLIREDYTGRFFWSSIEAVNKAVNEINALVIQEGSARLSDFYDLLGLSHVSTSDYFGFTKHDLVQLDWNTSTTPDGQTPVHTFEYVNHPVMDPERDASFR